MQLEELRSSFAVIRKLFYEADTIEEKLQLLAISRQILREAEEKLAQFGRTFQSQRYEHSEQ